MLTYNLQPRCFSISTPGGKFEFPNNIIIEMNLGPSNAFGGKEQSGRTVLSGQENKIIYNTNTGRMLVEPIPPLQPLNIFLEFGDSRFRLEADILRYEAICQNIQQLEDIILALYFNLPVLLNVDFIDPPIVLSIKGWVGNIEFRWAHFQSQCDLHNTNKEILENSVTKNFRMLSLFSEINNLRLIAALKYFYIASRLMVCGNSIWEFMAEYILNLSKSLEILFGNSRNDIRNGLQKIGYSSAEIEGDFIPILILRNFLDVGHPKLAVHDLEQRKIVYAFLYNSETKFRNLFKKLIKEISEGRYEIKQEIDFEPSNEDKRKMGKLIEVLKSRLNLDK